MGGFANGLLLKYGLVGWNFAHVNVDANPTLDGCGTSYAEEGEPGSGLVYGLGAKYMLMSNMSVAVEWRRQHLGYNVDYKSGGIAKNNEHKIDINSVSVWANMKF